jgi:hypothetical protein
MSYEQTFGAKEEWFPQRRRRSARMRAEGAVHHDPGIVVAEFYGEPGTLRTEGNVLHARLTRHFP